ncbi:histidine--tRNA ligase [Phaeovibrio sulfidiphilus]|uniref:Histidine--tRNA ligase n=1 Tax=Phaeovibrio sulfidiphilus TaxID=1220600 RepID=A0A8J7CD31_9PROT|nr:histidine--tRNA ligase [Phaeovibrio sulfidiphilus]MBE1236619.1 histidine--tRNA ligase [Phaeovibrio sulfidiphilus]
MAALQSVRGTHDSLPAEAFAHRAIEDTARAVAARFGYGEIITPIFEFTDVFARTLGDTSDIVTKEMYTFEDRSGDSLTLRPEGTAGVARAFISEGLAQSVPVKLFYRGPMFRHERPQKGRLRQFHQVGVELLGVEGPEGDVEVLSMGARLLEALGLLEHTELHLNTLGDAESRAAYRERLIAYFQNHESRLSEDSRNRLHRNPLRILDSKDPGDREIVAGAPVLQDSLNDTSRAFFESVRRGLDLLEIPYVVDPLLVRGLDYYSHTAFEFVTTQLGAQGTVLAGGRYDGLVKQMGGPPTPGIGWAAGVERLAMLRGLEAAPLPRPLAMIPVSGDTVDEATRLADRLRRADFAVDAGYSGNMTKRLKRANKANARAAILVGPDELAQNAVLVRDLDTGDQELVALDALEQTLARFR